MTSFCGPSMHAIAVMPAASCPARCHSPSNKCRCGFAPRAPGVSRARLSTLSDTRRTCRSSRIRFALGNGKDHVRSRNRRRALHLTGDVGTGDVSFRSFRARHRSGQQNTAIFQGDIKPNVAFRSTVTRSANPFGPPECSLPHFDSGMCRRVLILNLRFISFNHSIKSFSHRDLSLVVRDCFRISQRTHRRIHIRKQATDNLRDSLCFLSARCGTRKVEASGSPIEKRKSGFMARGFGSSRVG
jgi:hypothetical protein